MSFKKRPIKYTAKFDMKVNGNWNESWSVQVFRNGILFATRKSLFSKGEAKSVAQQIVNSELKSRNSK